MSDHLADYILITDPLFDRKVLDEILILTEGLQWRVPEQTNYERSCTTFPISSTLVGNFPLPSDRMEHARRIDNTLLEAVRQALHLYNHKYPIFTKSDSGFDILRYETGQRIDYHMDDLQPRILSMSIALNDDYTGGEFRFWKKENMTFRIPLGSAIMFPPNFMYPHEILPITSGTRYSMITWFS